MTADTDALAELFSLPVVPPDLARRYNIAPTDRVAVVRLDRQGQRRLDLVRWGLVPHWTRAGAVPAGSIPAGPINARAETLAKKPTFRDAWRRRRCLVVASGFFEWKRTAERKQPYLIQLADGAPFAFAGLWERWHRADGTAIDSCAIITTAANALVQLIHDRMPAVIEPSSFERWLAREPSDLEALRQLLAPPSAQAFVALPVSTHVNRPGNDDPSCIEHLGDPLTLPG